MKSFVDEVQYFNSLLKSNIEKAKKQNKDSEKERQVFYNINIKSNGTELAFYIDDDDYICTLKVNKVYEMYRKELNKIKIYGEQGGDSNEFLIYAKAVYYIPRLLGYSNKEESFEDLVGIERETCQVVRDILVQKNNIIDQLKLLREYRNLVQVQEYIDYIYNKKYTSQYVKYLIDKYYFNKEGLIMPEKTALDNWGDLLLD